MTREEAREQLECIYTEVSTEEDREAIDMAIEALKEPKQGEWIKTTSGDYECSKCKSPTSDEFPYCPWCGARMKEGDEK